MKIPFIALTLLLGSCVQEQPLAQEEVTGGKMVTIRVTVPESGDTKVAFTPESGKLALSWETTDCIRVISGSDSQVYTISNIISDHEAEFTGYAVSGSSFDIICPGTYASVTEAEEDTTSPTQTGNGSTSHLVYKALLSGVNTYEDIAFTSTWAGEHGGSFKNGAVVKLEATLPSGVTTLKKAAIRLGGNDYSLPLSGVDVSADGQVLTAYMSLPWQDIAIPDGSTVAVYAMATDNEVYSAVLPITGDKTIKCGSTNSFTNVDLALADFVDGDGSEQNPYLIANARQLENMMNLYKNAAAPADQNSFKYWFRQVEDVDASAISWTPLNNSGSFYKAIDYDGGDHTITGLTSSTGSYPSFAGVLYGSIRNLTFDGATVSGSTKKGVVAGFLGTTGLPASCENVHVKNSSVSGGNYSGGFAGHVRTTGEIIGCSVENTTVSTTSGYVGGFTAFTDITGTDKYEVPARFTDCHVVDVTVTQEYTGSTELYAGGFIGCANTGNGFTGCTVKATVNVTNTSMKDAGGFIGRASYACPTFKDCHVLDGSAVNMAGPHAGGFVGYSMVAASYSDCSSAATVTNSSEYTGGFVGYSAGASTYTDCSASGNVTSTKHAGGFVGTTENSAFNDCYYKDGTVTEKASGKSQSGGFCGFATTGVSFRGCYVKDATFTSASGTYVGGFVGQLGNSYAGGNNVSAIQCHVEGTAVTGSTNCGGFVGVQYDNISSSYVSGGSVTAKNAHCGGFSGFVQNGNLTNCYSTAAVNGASYAQVGGLAGIVYTTSISYCYAAGTVTASGSDIGAFVGKCEQQGTNPTATISSCIGWNASLPFCGTNTVGATLTDCYAGTDGTVSARAIAQAWPAAYWDTSAALPTLVASPRRLNAAFIGDSITWQWAVTSRTDSKSSIVIPIDPLPSYMTASGDKITTYFHPGFFTGNDYIDKGVSGQNTTQMLKRFQGDIIAQNPAVVVIMGGTNDIAQGYTTAEILEKLKAMAEMADAAGIKVVMCSVTPNNRYYNSIGSYKGPIIISLNDMIKSYAASKGFTYCDYWSAMVDTDGLAMNPDYLLYDDLHPGPAGYDVMEAIIKPIIDGLL